MTDVILSKSKNVRNIKGQRFGRLVAIDISGKTKNGQTMWLCHCDCGNIFNTRIDRLKQNGGIVSCGCYKPQTVHGMKKSPEYKSWRGIRERCLNLNGKDYDNYIGRGITLCDRWNGKDGFVNFFADMGKKPEGRYSIERINNNGNYEPSNCKWATDKEQCRNTRRNRIITIFGKSMTMAEACEIYKVNRNTTYSRLERGMSPEDAFTR